MSAVSAPRSVPLWVLTSPSGTVYEAPGKMSTQNNYADCGMGPFVEQRLVSRGWEFEASLPWPTQIGRGEEWQIGPPGLTPGTAVVVETSMDDEAGRQHVRFVGVGPAPEVRP